MTTPRSAVLPAEVAALWPAPARATWSFRCAPSTSGYLVVPSAVRPRLLVPTGVQGADRMLIRYAGGPATRAARALFRRSLTSRLQGRVPVRKLCVVEDPDGIERYLADQLDRDIRLGVLLGPPRPNRKPVLQLFDSAGRTVAFAKVGTTPLAARLLEREGATLAFLAERRPTTFTAPGILHRGTWRGMPVLVQEALGLAQARLSPAEPPVSVLAEIAGVNGIRCVPPSSGGRDRTAVNPSWFGLDLRDFERLDRLLDNRPGCPMGSWHGDFGPWNLATTGEVTQVWDWERFESDVPVGLDAAHYRTQQSFGSDRDPADAWPRICADIAEVLTACGQPTDSLAVVAGAYIVAIRDRYVTDATDGPTPMLRRRMTWLAALAALAVDALQDGAE